MGSWQNYTMLRYDLGVVSSALQKCVRRGAEKEALYWAAEMAESVYDGYLWRRLITIAAEDVGLGDPRAMGVLMEGYERWKKARVVGEGGRRLERGDFESLAQVVVYLCRAKKNREADDLAYLMTCRFGSEDKQGNWMGKDPKTGIACPGLVIPLPPGRTEVEELERCVGEGKEFEAVYWAYVLRKQKREMEVWDVLERVGGEIRGPLANVKAGRLVYKGASKEPDPNILVLGILLVCRRGVLCKKERSVPGGYEKDAMELMKRILSLRRGVDPETGGKIPRLRLPMMKEYLDGHTTEGKRKISEKVKETGLPRLLLWNKEFYEDVARLNRPVEVPGEKNWMEEMCTAAGCDWRVYREPKEGLTPVKEVGVKVDVQDLGGGKFKVESFSEPGNYYEVDVEAQTCTCPAFREGKMSMCKHQRYLSERGV